MPFRLFITLQNTGNISFKDWEKLKSRLTNDILRGNDIEEMMVKTGEAITTLGLLGKMDLDDQQKNSIREYLTQFLQNYLNDSRFKELLDSYSKNKQVRNQHLEEFIDIPSKILCVIAIITLQKEEVLNIGDLLMNYYNHHSMAEKYILNFLSDLYYYGNIETTSVFLESTDFSSFTEKGKRKIELLRIAVKANRTRNQKETWYLFFQEHQKYINKIKGTSNEHQSVFDLDESLTYMFLKIYPRQDYHLLIQLAKDSDIDGEFFFMLQLYQIIECNISGLHLETLEKKMIYDTMEQFVKKYKVPKSAINETIYCIIEKNYKSMLKRIEEKIQ